MNRSFYPWIYVANTVIPLSPLSILFLSFKRASAPASTSSAAIGSMATHIESEMRESSESVEVGGPSRGVASGGVRAGGGGEEGEVNDLRASLSRMKRLENQLRRDNARQQNEISKMKALNNQLKERSHAEGRDGFRRTSSMSVVPPGNSEWQAFQDDEGHTYYYNAKTFECSYDVPRKW